MGFTEESSFENPIEFRCYIPTSGKKQAIAPTWQYQPICLISPENVLGTDENPFYVEESVLASWAILLKSYTGSEVNSFARLHYESRREATDAISCSDMESTRIDSHLVSYSIDSGTVLRHIREYQLQSYDRADPEDLPVNTAVLLSRSLGACSIDNDERPLPGTTVDSEILDRVGNSLCSLSLVIGSRSFLHIIRRC